MKITEPQMFRVVVIVGVAMIPVILLAALVAPIAGAILFGIELGAAIGFLIQRIQAARSRAPVPSVDPEGESADHPSQSELS